MVPNANEYRANDQRIHLSRGHQQKTVDIINKLNVIAAKEITPNARPAENIESKLNVGLYRTHPKLDPSISMNGFENRPT
jgi:hypothetical protein